MNLNQLRVFYAVAKAGSISGAAQTLRVSQPAVSKQLGELEATLGASLVDRLPRGVRLTRVGRALEHHASQVFAAEQAAELELATLTGSAQSRFSVGASTTIGNYLVPTIFGSLRRLYPELQLTLVIGNTQAVQEWVAHDRVDVGLTEGLVTHGDLRSESFSADELIAVAAPGSAVFTSTPLSLARFLEEPMIVRERGSGTREVVESALAERSHSLRPVMELGSSEAVKNAVAERLGVAFLPSLTVELELRSGRLVRVPLSDFSLQRSLQLVELRHRPESSHSSTFKRLLAQPHSPLRPTEYAI